MKVAPLERAFSEYSNIEHSIIHTGQHYDKNMSDAFFDDLNMPHPKYFMGVGSGSHAEQTSKIMLEFEKLIETDRPDLVVVVGDVNSTLACSIVAVKAGIKVAHIEAGLRSFDRRMPEEINRMVTDSISDYYFVTEQAALDNLKNEGIDDSKVFFVGNTMIDSLRYAENKSDVSKVLENLKLSKNEYVLATTHRPSNVDTFENLKKLLAIFVEISKTKKVVFPVHPRTRNNFSKFGLTKELEENPNIILSEPLGYVDFLALMKNSFLVLTDSGGIQEETTALGVNCITIRENTERPSTVEIGTNFLTKPEFQAVIDVFRSIELGTIVKESRIPPLWDGKTAYRIVNIINNKILNNEI